MKNNRKSKCEFRDARTKCCNMADQLRPLEKANVANVLKNVSAVVVVEEVMCEKINIDSTNKFKITEW